MDRTPALTALLLLALASPAFAGHGGPPPGQLLVVNESGGTVEVALDGRTFETLRPGGQLSVPVAPGATSVSATYRQFGATRLLETETAVIKPNRTAVVVLDPEDDAFVLVRNATRYDADLIVDGRYAAHLGAGTTQVVEVDVGSGRFELVARSGRSLGTTRMVARPFTDHRWTVELPTVADVTVTNPLPIPIELTTSRGQVRSVPAYGRTVYDDVPLGTFQLTATRVTGEIVDVETLVVREDGANGWRIDAPTTGLVWIDSEHFDSTRVIVDGTTLAALPAWGEQRLELPIGWHHVAITDERGRVVEDTWIEVDPYELAVVEAALPVRPSTHHQHPVRPSGSGAAHGPVRPSYSMR